VKILFVSQIVQQTSNKKMCSKKVTSVIEPKFQNKICQSYMRLN